MANITRNLEAGLVTSKGAETETTAFTAGDEVEIIKEWQEFWLVKDQDGHFYNLPKDAVQP